MRARIVTTAMVAAASAVLASCAEEPEHTGGGASVGHLLDKAGHSHGDSSPPSASPDDETDVSVDIEITAGEVSPPPGRIEVERGQTVRIEVTSDQPDDLHLHGYDLAGTIGPGENGIFTFTADQPGIFELETHNSGLVLTQLVVE